MIFGKKKQVLCWRLLAETNIGYSHVKKDIVNQDAVGFLPNKDKSRFYVVAVADGHGAKECIRSDIGSKIAIRIATKFGLKNVKSNRSLQGLLSKKRKRDLFVRTLVNLWKKATSNHLKQNPLTSSELELLAQLDDSKKNAVINNQLMYYGTTLLIALVRDDDLVLFQIGDGDICFVSSDDSVSIPIVPTGKLIANETTSICMKKSESLFHAHSLSKSSINMIVLSSDGYSNSFACKEDFFKVGKDLYDMLLNHGIEKIKKQLPQWLEETSRTGSGDDISIALLIRDNILKTCEINER